ncbi:hypothetical protein KKE26_06505 [bacterium]|nr:hypothetical protein [bacterium]
MIPFEAAQEHLWQVAATQRFPHITIDRIVVAGCQGCYPLVSADTKVGIYE